MNEGEGSEIMSYVNVVASSLFFWIFNPFVSSKFSSSNVVIMGLFIHTVAIFILALCHVYSCNGVAICYGNNSPSNQTAMSQILNFDSSSLFVLNYKFSTSHCKICFAGLLEL